MDYQKLDEILKEIGRDVANRIKVYSIDASKESLCEDNNNSGHDNCDCFMICSPTCNCDDKCWGWD